MWFLWGDLRERDWLEGVDCRIILKWTFKTWNAGINWIDLDEDRDRLWTLVNDVMNLRVP